MRVNVDVLHRQLRALSCCSNRLILSSKCSLDATINKLSSSIQLQDICLMVMRTLIGPLAAKREDMVVFVHVYLHTTHMMHTKAKNLANLLVANNPGLLLAMTTFGNMFKNAKHKCFLRTPINSVAMCKAWITCVVLFRASAKNFQSVGENVYIHAFMAKRRTNMLLAAPQTQDAESSKVGPFVVKRLLHDWEREYNLLHASSPAYYARPWLAEDDYDNDELSQAQIRDQWLYQLVLDPAYITNQPDGRAFAPSPRYQAVHSRIFTTFWKQLGFEIHQEYTPCYSKVVEALELIYARLYSMLEQQGLTKLPDYCAEIAMLKLQTESSFAYHEQNMALFNEIAASLLAYHYYGSERFQRVSQWTARRNVILGNQIFDQISLLSQIESQMHLRLEGLYIIVTEVMLQDRKDIFQQNVDGWLPKGGIAYLQARFMPLDLTKTQVWLRRYMEPGQTVKGAFSKAMVDLAANAPAMLAVFPETFANDKRDFLAFYNQMEYFVDLCMVLDLSRNSVKAEEVERMCAQQGQKLHVQHAKYDPIRMLLMRRMIRYMERLKYSEEELGDALLVDTSQWDCVNQGFAKFMRRFSRLADVNWQIYGEYYTQALSKSF